MFPRKLTNKDVPFLRECLASWSQLFGVPLDRSQLIIWAQIYPQDAIRKSFGITRGWADAKASSGKPTTEVDAYRYTAGVLRNLYKHYAIADKLLGVQS
jgi:hypothetical protein